MELEIYEAFTSAGVAQDKARAVVESMNKEIDRRYSLHAAQLATRADLAEVKTEITKVKTEIAEAKAEIIKWNIMTIIAAVAIGISATRFLH